MCQALDVVVNGTFLARWDSPDIVRRVASVVDAAALWVADGFRGLLALSPLLATSLLLGRWLLTHSGVHGIPPWPRIVGLLLCLSVVGTGFAALQVWAGWDPVKSMVENRYARAMAAIDGGEIASARRIAEMIPAVPPD